MNIHEFQAKGLLGRYGVTVPKGKVARTADEAAAIAREFGGVVVVKAQIHAGGRGKAGGVKVCKSPEEAREFAGKLIGRTLVTHQTGPAGREVHQVLVEEGCAIARELYLGLVIDRATGWPTVMASRGGRRGDRGGGGARAGEDPARTGRSGRRPAGVPGPQDRLCAGTPEGVHRQGGRVHDGAVPGLR